MLRIHLILLLSASLLLLILAQEVQPEMNGPRRLLQFSEDGKMQRYLGNAISNRNFRLGFSPPGFLEALRKRQIRYNQCYFNPVSCFGRK